MLPLIWQPLGGGSLRVLQPLLPSLRSLRSRAGCSLSLSGRLLRWRTMNSSMFRMLSIPMSRLGGLRTGRFSTVARFAVRVDLAYSIIGALILVPLFLLAYLKRLHWLNESLYQMQRE